MNAKARFLQVLIGVTVAASQAHGQTFEQALAHAYETNPKILAERETLKAVDESVPQALANWLPTVQAVGSAGYAQDKITRGGQTQPQSYPTQYPDQSFGLTMTQEIYRGGRTSAQTRQAFDKVAAEQARLSSIEQAVLLQAATDYADVVEARSALALADAQVAYLERHVLSLRARLKAGQATRTDLAQAEAAQAHAVVQREQARAKALAAEQNFQRDIGLPPSSLAYAEADLPLPDSSDDAVSLAVGANPDVIAAISTSDAARDAVDDADGAGRPTISVQGTLQRQNSGGAFPQQEDIASIVLQMRVPLYAGGLLSSQYRQAVNTASARQLEVDAARQKATADARNAWSSWSSTKTAILAAQAEASANAIAQEGVEHARDSGEKTELDVLNASQAALQSRFNLLQARHDELVARYALLSAVGRLTAKSLQLPVTLYNPDDHLKAVKYHFYWQ